MNDFDGDINRADTRFLARLAVDAFRRIIIHYGAWFAETAHQVGLEKAMAVEDGIWDASLKNQMTRLGKTLGFPVEDGIPQALGALPREVLIDLIQNTAVNWLANDGIWFQAVENAFGMDDAKRSNDTCWTRVFAL